MFLLAGLAAMGCNRNENVAAISTDLGRSGSELAPTPFQYIDWQPSLSDDGQKVAYVSGRDSTAGASVFKIYKANWPSGRPLELQYVLPRPTLALNLKEWCRLTATG